MTAQFSKALYITLTLLERVVSDEYLARVDAFRKQNRYYFTELDDWFLYPPCYTLPKVDPRSLINCCPIGIDCPVRDALLLAFYSRSTTREDLEFVRSSFPVFGRRLEEYL